MRWRWLWPWQWPEAAKALDAMAAAPDVDAGDCDHQELIDRLAAENDLLHQDLKELDGHDPLTCAQRVRDLEIEVREARWQRDRFAAEVDELKAEITLLRSRTRLPSREELLRLRETNERLARRINDMTRGVVTL